MQRVLVSGCLVGELVRHHGGHAQYASPIFDRWLAEGRVVTVCPEMLGGLPAPRPPSEIVGDRVVTRDGVDVTEIFDAGARISAETARVNDIRVAILKERSPSCGSAVIYDGTFSGAVIPGEGRTAALLRARGIRVFSEHELEAADAYLASLEL